MISIILPAYNAEAYLDRCLSSLIGQTCRDLEIIAVNDGSKDKTGDLLAKWAQKDERLRVYEKPNGGVSSARNLGLKKASGEYVMFVDADDWAAPTLCEKLLAALQNDHADFALCGYQCHDGDRESEVLPQVRSEDRFADQFYVLREKGLLNMPWGKLFKRERILASFDERLSYGEDLQFNLNYLECEPRIAVCAEALYVYDAAVSGSLSKNLEKNAFTQLRLNEMVEAFIARHKLAYPNFERAYYRSFRRSMQQAIRAGYTYGQMRKLFFRLCGEGGYAEIAKTKKTPGILNVLTRRSILMRAPMLAIGVGWAELKMGKRGNK